MRGRWGLSRGKQEQISEDVLEKKGRGCVWLCLSLEDLVKSHCWNQEGEKLPRSVQCLISCLTGAGNWAGLVAGRFLCLQSAKLSGSHLKPPPGRGSGFRNGENKKNHQKSFSGVSLETMGNKQSFVGAVTQGRL